MSNKRYRAYFSGDINGDERLNLEAGEKVGKHQA